MFRQFTDALERGETAQIRLRYTWPPMPDLPPQGPLPELSVDADKVPAFYATGIRVRTNPYDISFLFTRAIPTGSGKPADIELPVCVVSMSPPLLASLSRVCESHKAIYEAKYGKLPDMLKPAKEGEDA